MLTTLLTAALMSAAVAQQTDTVFAVRQGSRLTIENFSGRVVVRTWSRNEMRVVADHSSRTAIAINMRGADVELEAESRRGVPTAVDYEITVPVQTDVSIEGTFTDADVRGVQGEVTVETVQGQIVVEGGSGFVSLESVQGDIELTGATGKIDVQSVNGVMRLTSVAGEIYVEGVNGSVILTDINSSDVEATTTNGNISYDGSIEDDGRYSFSNHNGDVTVAIPAGTNATVNVYTFGGDFETTFPVTLAETRRQGRRYRFTIGKGGARIELESFNGRLRLRRR